MTAPARKPDNAPNPTPTPDLPPDIASSAEALGFGQLEDFFREAEKIIAEAEKAAEAATTPEEASRWERLKKFVRDINPFVKSEVEKAIDGAEKLKKDGVGDPPAKLTPKELSKADAIIEKIKEAAKKPRLVKLSGTRGDQLAVLSGMYEALAEQAKNDKPVDQDALYKKLLSQGAEYVVDPETGEGVYTKMTDKENARLAELEGRNISDADFKEIVDGKKPWDLNSLSRAMNMLRNNQLPGENDIERAHREKEENDPEKKLVNNMTTEYFSFTDIPGLSEGKKAKLVESAKNTPGNAECAKAMDRLIKTHSKEEVAKRAEQARSYLLEKIMQRLNIEPSKFSQSKSWVFREMARQYDFLEHPDLIELGDVAADPIISEQKLNEIISRQLGWELYRQKTQGPDNGLLGKLNNQEASYPEIIKLLDKKAEKNGSLSPKDLSSLGEFIRSNIGEYTTEEKDKTRYNLSVARAEENYKRADDELESIRTDLDIMDEINGTLTRAGRMAMIEHNLAMLGDYAHVGKIEQAAIIRFDENDDVDGKYKLLKELFDDAIVAAQEQEKLAVRRQTLADADLNAAKERQAKAATAKVAPTKTPDTMSDAEKETRIDAIMTRAHAYIGTEKQIKTLNGLDEVYLLRFKKPDLELYKETDLDNKGLDTLRFAICGDAWSGLKLKDAQLLEKEDLDILAKELLEIVNQPKDVRLANIKTSPTKPAPAPAKPAAGPASPNVKNVDTRNDEEKALVKKILVEVDKKIAQAQKDSLAYENDPATSALRETRKLIDEISSAKELKDMLVNAEYLTKEAADKLNDEEIALIRDQIVRDIDEVLFVKNSTPNTTPKKAPIGSTPPPAPDAKGEAERLKLRQEAVASAERKIETALAEKAADQKFTARKAENYVQGIADIPERAGGAISDRLFDAKYITAAERKVLLGADLIALRKKLLEGAKKIRDAKKTMPTTAKPDTGPTVPTMSEKEKHEKAMADISAAMEAWKTRLITDDSYSVEQAAFYLQTISHTLPTATFVLMNGMEKDGFISSVEQRGSLRSTDVVTLREKLIEEAKAIVDAKKSKMPTSPASKPPTPPISGTTPTIKAPPRSAKTTKTSTPVATPVTTPPSSVPNIPAPPSSDGGEGKEPGEPDKEVERKAALQTADLAVNALNDTLTELIDQERVTREQLETNLKTLRENKDVLGFLEASLSGHSFRDLSDKLTADDLMAIQRNIDAIMQNQLRELAQKNIEDNPDEEAKRERDAQITDVNREIPAQIPKTLTQEQFDAVMAKFAEYITEKKQKSPLTDEGLKELKRKYRPLVRSAAGLK